MEVLEKQKHGTTRLEHASYKVCVQPTILYAMDDLMHFEEKALDEDVEDLTSEDIEKVVDMIAGQDKDATLDSEKLDKIARNMSMDFSIKDPVSRLDQLVVKFRRLLAAEGIEHFIEGHP